MAVILKLLSWGLVIGGSAAVLGSLAGAVLVSLDRDLPWGIPELEWWMFAIGAAAAFVLVITGARLGDWVDHRKSTHLLPRVKGF